MKAGYLTILLLIPLLASAAQGYKIVHPDGTIEFSDQPATNAEEINLPQAQGFQSEVSSAPSSPPSAPPTQEVADYQQFAIATPAAEETVQHNEGVVAVSVRVSPNLKQGHQVVITLDGSEAAKGAATSFSLSGVDRGAHLLGASIVDSSGAVIRQASPVTFYVYQPSLLNPNRRR